MKLDRFILYAALAAALTVGLVLLAYQFTRPELPKQTQTLAYEFSVAEFPGFDVGVDKFRLGAVTPSSSSFRYLSISDPYASIVNGSQAGTPKRVRIVAMGPGSEWLWIEPDELLVPGVVKITVSVPKEAPFGIYQGTLFVIPVVDNQ